MNILLTGGSGTLGKSICEICINKKEFDSINIQAPTHNEMDITNYKSVLKYVGLYSGHTDLILHAAAFIGLANCENEKAKAYNTNVIGTAIMNRIAEHLGINLIYISTDYVFDGKKGMYAEDEIPNPIGYYAKTKWAGECVTQAYCRKIIRISFSKEVWPHDKAFIDKYSSFDTVPVITDLLLKCIKKHSKWNGILHIGTERKSFYDLAIKLKPDVQQTSYKQAGVNIPEDTSFDLNKMKEILK